jgi:hypothetical protein
VLARGAACECLPMAFRYRFFEHELPDVLVAVGEPHAPVALAEFASRLGATVGQLAEANTLDGFSLLLRGTRSAMERWDAARGLAT